MNLLVEVAELGGRRGEAVEHGAARRESGGPRVRTLARAGEDAGHGKQKLERPGVVGGGVPGEKIRDFFTTVLEKIKE